MNVKRDPDTGKIELGQKMKDFLDFQVRLLPLLLVLIGWGMRVEVFMGQGDRYTPKDARAMELAIKEEMRMEMGLLPPDWFRDDVAEIKRELHDVKEMLTDHRLNH